MAVSLFNCWHCDKRLAEKREATRTKKKAATKKGKKPEIEVDNLFFYCDQTCKDAHEKAIEKSARPYRQWSEYMCGEREKPPRKFAHLVDKWGWAKDRKQDDVVDDDPEPTKPKGRTCSKCGKPGHNARTCGRKKKAPVKKGPKKRGTTKKKTPKRRPAPPKKVVKKKTKGRKAPAKKRRRSTKKSSARRQYRCSICGGLGHNARSCDRRPVEPGEFDPKPVKVKVGKYKCGICGELGHNARTCPER